MEQIALAAAVVLFLLFLLWNGLLRAPLRRSIRETLESPDAADEELEKLIGQLREGAKTGPILQQIKKRVAEEPDGEIKAAYLCVVGDVLRRTLSRRGTALRWFLKALEVSPTCFEARRGMRELLLAQRRGYRLEQLYWRLLARLDPEETPCETIVEVWLELAEILERRRSGRDRAKAIRNLVDTFGRTASCDDEDEPKPSPPTHE